jgi:hypothetical protein
LKTTKDYQTNKENNEYKAKSGKRWEFPKAFTSLLQVNNGKIYIFLLKEKSPYE